MMLQQPRDMNASTHKTKITVGVALAIMAHKPPCGESASIATHLWENAAG
jgi:hypothetical protein